MRVAIVSTYPPRPCGIGIFTSDLRAAILSADASTAVDVVSIVRDPAWRDPPEVVAAIRQDVRSDYAAVARTLTSRGTDVVLVEHEYGIFGGDAGDFVLSLVEELAQPLVVTLHTVLSTPSVRQAEALRALCRRATLVTVFTETARRMILEARVVPPERIRVVPHGAPELLVRGQQLSAASDMDAIDPHSATGTAVAPRPAVAIPRPALERLEGRTVLSTFGLISAGKGIELAIQALPAVVAAHPEVLYLVAGQTHPEVVNQEGESYRLGLERLVRDLGLGDHVHFLDRFLTVEELAVLLSSTDLYLTPYRSREQIVSGALTFAVVAGCPVVSTPYYYAEDLLRSGAGTLIPFEDSAALSSAVLHYLDHPDALQAAREEARRVGAGLIWPTVGAVTLQVLGEAIHLGPAPRAEKSVPTPSSPRIRPDHLLTMVDDVGIIQHAYGVVPNRETGYCVDDIARLVVVTLGLEREIGHPSYNRMLAFGLAFLRHAWDPSGQGMRNFMTYDRQWADLPHEGDHVGRTAWALGEVIAAQPPRAVAVPSLRMLEEMATLLEGSTSPREVAFAVIGLCRPSPEALPDSLHKLLRTLADRLARWYGGARTDDWRWFEGILTYDNARLPQALIAAGRRLADEDLLNAGLEALDWYAAQCDVDGPAVTLIGNRWRRPGVRRSWPDEGDEQPVNAAALVEALTEALVATGRRKYGQQAVRAFEWFLGRNRLGATVYDFATGGCRDGLGVDGPSVNEGAESTLAFLQALLALDAAGLQASLPAPHPT